MKTIKKLIPILTTAVTCCTSIPVVTSCSKEQESPTNFLEWDATKGAWQAKISGIEYTPFEDEDAATDRYFDDIEKNNLILCEDYMYRFYTFNLLGQSSWDYVSILVNDINSTDKTISIEITTRGWMSIDDTLVYALNVLNFNNFKMYVVLGNPSDEQAGAYNGFRPVNEINTDEWNPDLQTWIDDKKWSLSYVSERSFMDGKRDTYKYESNSAAVSQLSEPQDKSDFINLVDYAWTGSLYMGGAYIDD